MYYIIGDIGNTSTKISLFNKSKIAKSIVIDTKKILYTTNFKKILNKFLKKNMKNKILFSCVVPLVLKKIS